MLKQGRGGGEAPVRKHRANMQRNDDIGNRLDRPLSASSSAGIALVSTAFVSINFISSGSVALDCQRQRCASWPHFHSDGRLGGWRADSLAFGVDLRAV